MSLRRAALRVVTAVERACAPAHARASSTRARAALWSSSSSPPLEPPSTAIESARARVRVRTYASGLTVDGGVTPAVEAVPTSIARAPSDEAWTRDLARGTEARRKEVFCVVQIRSHQFKVSPDALIYVDKVKDVEVNDVVTLPRVLMLGNKSETVIGRPTVPGAEVVALVEEHVRDGKKLIFKKKRRKNHRRMNGYRAQLTGLRVLEIRGIEEA